MKTHIYALIALSALLSSSMPAFARHDAEGPQVPRRKIAKKSEEDISKTIGATREPTSKASSELAEPQKVEQPTIEKKTENESDSTPSKKRPFHHVGAHGA